MQQSGGDSSPRKLIFSLDETEGRQRQNQVEEGGSPLKNASARFSPSKLLKLQEIRNTDSFESPLPKRSNVLHLSTDQTRNLERNSSDRTLLAQTQTQQSFTLKGRLQELSPGKRGVESALRKLQEIEDHSE